MPRAVLEVLMPGAIRWTAVTGPHDFDVCVLWQLPRAALYYNKIMSNPPKQKDFRCRIIED